MHLATPANLQIIILCLCIIYVLSILVSAQGDPGVVIAYPGQDVEIPCSINITDGTFTSWMVNGALYTLAQIFNGELAGHNISGRNIVVENIITNDVRNGTEYRCIVLQIPPTPDIISEPIFLYIAGELLDKLDSYHEV